jgi:hypothetical protein
MSLDGDEETTPAFARNGENASHSGPSGDRHGIGPRETSALKQV